MQDGLEMITADSPALAVPRGPVIAGDRLMQLDPSRALVRTQFVDECEFVAPSRAVQERDFL